MNQIKKKNQSWKQSIKNFLKPSVLRMLFLGFSAGMPILLIFSSLSLWLREAGVERSAVTFFSWAALGYSFKFVWAPLVDKLPLPLLHKKLGRRRSWLLLSQIFIIVGIMGMALIDPAKSPMSLNWMAMFAVVLGFSSATQDISIDAYRIESDSSEMQGLLSSTYIAGYRVGMIVAGAGALFLASWFGSTKEAYSYQAWFNTYAIMAACMLVGVITTLIIPEPKNRSQKKSEYSTKDYSKFFFLFLTAVGSFVLAFVFLAKLTILGVEPLTPALGDSLSKFLMESIRLLCSVGVAVVTVKALMKTPLVNKDMVEDTYVAPVKDFFQRYGNSVAILLLALVGLYRISDIVLGIISNVFYQDLGFSKNQIASVVKTFGLIMTLVGGFLGGILTVRYGVMRMMFLGALLSAGTNLLFLLLSNMGDNLSMLYLVISADNLSAGLASAAFVAFLSSLTNISFTAVQYAIFTSLMTLFPKVLGGYSGTMVDNLGYSGFFIATTLMGVPVLWLVWLAGKKLDINDGGNKKEKPKKKSKKKIKKQTKKAKTTSKKKSRSAPRQLDLEGDL